MSAGTSGRRASRRRSDQTAQTRSQVSDTERGLTANVAQQFIGVLLAKANLQLANTDLESFQKTVDLSQESFRAGAMSEGDLLKIKLQLLQFQMDVSCRTIDAGADVGQPAPIAGL